MSTFEKFNSWLKSSITVRSLVILILILLLLIPTSMVTDLIRERKSRKYEAQREVSEKWGGSQIVTGPIVTIPYKRSYMETDINGHKKISYTKELAHFLPEELNIDGSLSPEIRHRGIYKVAVYASTLNISGKFETFDFDDFKVSPYDVYWDEAYVSLGISDMKGIQERIVMEWNDQILEFGPGLKNDDLYYSGASVDLPLDSLKEGAFELTLKLNGSDGLQFSPIGEVNNVHLDSKWPNPSFFGTFLPDKRSISTDGFTADWKVLNLNRNFPQKWINNAHKVNQADFGLNLYIPVDHYQKSTRSAKYAIMFIALTFLSFFFMEIMNKKRIHPIQYILVGLALCIFYALLLSLSEQLNFNWAYLIASIAVVGLIVSYIAAIFKSGRLTLITTGILTMLYSFVFVIIQLEDSSLLMGSIGLFIVLAVVMYFSRNIQWSTIGKPSPAQHNEDPLIRSEDDELEDGDEIIEE
ncbi:MAG: cell envelope integrity protein CreD [Flavobacteriales bacterium]|nr:cell envelope integrity protein CreD [Flavobacteriales bacterium]